MIQKTLTLLAVLTIRIPDIARAQSGYMELWMQYRGSVGSPGISADGESFYAFVQQWDEEAGERVTQIRHYSMDGDELEPDIQRSRPRFSSTGAHHAFKSDDDEGNYGIFVFDVARQEYRFLAPVREAGTFLGHRARRNYVWSPDGSEIAYISAHVEPGATNGSGADEGRVDAGDDEPEWAPIVSDRLLFKSRTALSSDLRSHIYVIPVEGGERRQLTDGEYDEHSIDWSPDGREIVFVSDRSADPDDVHKNDLWTVNVADGKIRRLTRTDGPEFSPQYSPDGKWIAFLGADRSMNTRDSPMETDHLKLIPSDGGSVRNLTLPLDRRLVDCAWSGDSEHLFFTAHDEGSIALYRVDLRDGSIHPVVTGDMRIAGFAVSPTRDRIVYRAETSDRGLELHVVNFDGSWQRQVTRAQDSFVANVPVAEADTFWFESFDGTPVQGWLTKPTEFDPEDRYPAVLEIHGGPHSDRGYRIYDWPAQVMAVRGYAVVQINPRGSVGYGQEFADGTLRDWGGGDFEDLMTGMDAVLARNAWLDSERLGVLGYSYGGYMTNWVITQTDRFRAALAGGSVSNLISFYGTSIYHLLVETEFPGEAWENCDLLWDRSPLKHVANVTTPTLFVHGDDDHDVPIEQAEEMYIALKKLGVEAQLVRYPDVGHMLGGAAYFDLLERTPAWFDRFLRPEQVP
jgi:dipeptidyl aminopeptidase/acylaminoacyl peptidase